MRIPADTVVVAIAASLFAVSPAYALSSGPAPVAGLGIGAAMLIGTGYRALKKRIGR